MRTFRKWVGLILLVLPVVKYVQDWKEESKRY